MSVIENLAGIGHSTPHNADFVAFLSDVASAQIMERFVLEQMLPHTLVRQGGINDAISALAHLERPPRQLVVDISTSAMPLSDLAALADACPPNVSVVVVGERNDIGLFRELLRMGVDDYLAKPLTPDLLRRVLGRHGGVAEPVHQVRTGKLVACLGARGGVGTTTVAVNMAWHLANTLERRVALIDLDRFGGAVNVLLGLETNNGLIELLKNVNRLDPQYMERTLVAASPKLYVLSAQQEYSDTLDLDPESLALLIAELKKHFHYVILDLPERGGLLASSILPQAQVVALVTEPTVQTARETVRLMRFAETRDTHGALMLIVNQPRQTGRNELHLKDFEDAIARKASHVLPFDRDIAGKAENLGPPVISTRTPLANALRDVADDLSGRQHEAEALGAHGLKKLVAKFLHRGP